MCRKCLVILSIFAIFFTYGCSESLVKADAKTVTGQDMGLPPYTGPRAKVVVADFEWKVGLSGSETTMTFGSQKIAVSHTKSSGYTTGLRDMLTTAMIQSKRYRVLAHQNLNSLKQETDVGASDYTNSSGKKKGWGKGADLLIMGAITGWETGTSGSGGGIGGGTLRETKAPSSSLKGASNKSSMAMDIRIIDTQTSEVLAATQVEGVATDVNLGRFIGSFGGSRGMSDGLGSYAKTPMEKAIRTCLYHAVYYIVENTPQSYMKY